MWLCTENKTCVCVLKTKHVSVYWKQNMWLCTEYKTCVCALEPKHSQGNLAYTSTCFLVRWMRNAIPACIICRRKYSVALWYRGHPDNWLILYLSIVFLRPKDPGKYHQYAGKHWLCSSRSCWRGKCSSTCCPSRSIDSCLGWRNTLCIYTIYQQCFSG